MLTSLSINHGGLGRFGNQLFTIAGVIGTAAKNGQPFGFPEWITRDNELFGQKADKMSDYFVNPLPGLNGIPETAFKKIPYFWGYEELRLPHGNWDIFAHMQDPRYFEDYMPLIRHYFRMKDEPEQNDYVAIHYRAGDYIDDPDAYHPRCGIEYYREAVKHFEDGVNLVVFSDDNDAAQFLIDGMALKKTCIVSYVDRKCSYIDSFKLMKRCKSFITANSSFSLMAAILGEHPDKKIICPSRWFGKQAGIEFSGYPKGAVVA